MLIKFIEIYCGVILKKAIILKNLRFKDSLLLPCWYYKNDLVKYFMQHIRNGLIIDLIKSSKNNIC